MFLHSRKFIDHCSQYFFYISSRLWCEHFGISKKNVLDIFRLYYIHSTICSRFESTSWHVIPVEIVNNGPILVLLLILSLSWRWEVLKKKQLSWTAIYNYDWGYSLIVGFNMIGGFYIEWFEGNNRWPSSIFYIEKWICRNKGMRHK